MAVSSSLMRVLSSSDVRTSEHVAERSPATDKSAFCARNILCETTKGNNPHARHDGPHSGVKPYTPDPSDRPDTAGPSAKPSTPGPSAKPLTPGPSAQRLTPGPSAKPLTPGPSAKPSTPGPSAKPLTPGPSAKEGFTASSLPLDPGTVVYLVRSSSPLSLRVLHAALQRIASNFTASRLVTLQPGIIRPLSIS